MLTHVGLGWAQTARYHGVISVVIPAHNESAVIGRLLTALLADADPDEFEVIVVPNGCTDDTEAVAKSFGDAVTVVSTPLPSKHAALRLGDAQATPGLARMTWTPTWCSAPTVPLARGRPAQPGVLAAAPERDIPLADRPLIVRWYYDVWLRLPVVRDGLFGRGVIAVSPQAQERIAALPNVTATIWPRRSPSPRTSAAWSRRPRSWSTYPGPRPT